jgi:hypothetical protein
MPESICVCIPEEQEAHQVVTGVPKVSGVQPSHEYPQNALHD